jgi:hypothetical protein
MNRGSARRFAEAIAEKPEPKRVLGKFSALYSISVRPKDQGGRGMSRHKALDYALDGIDVKCLG